MKARRVPRIEIEINPIHVEVPDLYYAFVRLAVMAAGAGIIAALVR